ncbi:MAG: hypothetical protein IJ975_00545 [Clostridia bacterium]|nr:hypothetical protein [Clostridia bacterium]
MLQTQTQTMAQIIDQPELEVIILLYQNPAFKGAPRAFDLEICGKPMWKFVELAAGAFPIKTTICTPESDVLEIIKPMLGAARHTLVLYSDTPLIKKSTILEIAAFAEVHDVNVLKLPRGYVFNTEYIKTAENIIAPSVQYFGDEDFIQVFDFRQLEFVTNILQNRILEFHQKNGVFIKNLATTFIDADVVIEPGVVIAPNNHILGSSIISRGTKLLPNNVLQNATIGANCMLCGAYINGAKIPSGTRVEAYQKIEG